jgi:hypothetical protein
MHQMRISTQVSSVMLKSEKLEIRKKSENWKSRRMKTKQRAMKLSKIRRWIELCLRDLILRFEMNLQILLFSWQLNSYSYFKAVPKYLVTGLWRHSRTNSPSAEASTQGLKCKTNTLKMLMHQMHMSTTQVSSVMLKSEKLEIREKKWKLKAPLDENQRECHEIEPKQSKDSFMP